MALTASGMGAAEGGYMLEGIIRGLGAYWGWKEGLPGGVMMKKANVAPTVVPAGVGSPRLAGRQPGMMFVALPLQWQRTAFWESVRGDAKEVAE